jgi:hypothetical protein
VTCIVPSVFTLFYSVANEHTKYNWMLLWISVFMINNLTSMGISRFRVVYRLGGLFGSVGHKVKIHKITPVTGKERGDIEIKDYVVLQKPQGQDNRLRAPLLELWLWITQWLMLGSGLESKQLLTAHEGDWQWFEHHWVKKDFKFFDDEATNRKRK